MGGTKRLPLLPGDSLGRNGTLNNCVVLQNTEVFRGGTFCVLLEIDRDKGSRHERKVQFFLTLFKPMFKNYVVKIWCVLEVI